MPSLVSGDLLRRGGHGEALGQMQEERGDGFLVEGEVKLVLRGDRKSDFFERCRCVTHTKTDTRSLSQKKILSKGTEKDDGLIENIEL